MMLFGILAGLASAVLQSCSYVASALFLKRHGNPREMLFYSQGVQALFALPLFFLLVPAGALSDSGIWLAHLYWLAIFSVTQLSMSFRRTRATSAALISTSSAKSLMSRSENGSMSYHWLAPIKSSMVL